MQLKLYNSLNRKTEVFQSIDEANKVATLYVCGPTVYDFAHIGNFRAFLNADVLRRTLESIGYTVKQVMNITDVGHMTEDDLADGGGEDKIQVATTRMIEAKKSGNLPEGVDLDPTDPLAVVDYYANVFMEDATSLGLLVIEDEANDHTVMPRPTQYIKEMISMVETLIEKDHAYVADDSVVYFDVNSYAAYGTLSGNTLESLRSGEGGRVDMGTQSLKRNPADFMLWKPDGKHLMRWQSPWGEGYPGWHLECSVMAIALLGEVIDIHSGGEDNIFPHHECEIAQSCCATDHELFAKFWFHTRFLLVDGGKMSKSKGNFYTLRDLVSKGASPAAIRLELIKTHYRSNANFTIQGLKDSQRQIERWKRLEQWLTTHQDKKLDGEGSLTKASQQFFNCMCDDLNVSGAIGTLSEAVSTFDLEGTPQSGGGPHTYADELQMLHNMDHVLGVLQLESVASTDTIDVQAVELKIQERLDARESQDWNRADEIRDELLSIGIEIKDSQDGTTWSRVVR